MELMREGEEAQRLKRSPALLLPRALLHYSLSSVHAPSQRSRAGEQEHHYMTLQTEVFFFTSCDPGLRVLMQFSFKTPFVTDDGTCA